jgi:hypothetical protein
MALVAPPLPHGTPANLRRLGVSLSDDTAAFFLKFGESIGAASPMRKAGAEIKRELAVGFVGQLRDPAITLKEVETFVEKHGGKKRWVKSIEALLDHQFDAPKVPESAALVRSTESPLESPDWVNQPIDIKCSGISIGAMLKKKGKMHLLDFDRALVLGVVEETVMPEKNPLEYNDMKRVMTEVFLWVLLTFKSKRKCVIMFRYLANRLHDIFTAHSAASFVSKLHNRWKNGVRANAEVSSMPR